MTPSEKLDSAVKEMFKQFDYLIEQNKTLTERNKHLQHELKDMEYQRDRAHDIVLRIYGR